jgi:hypothetical protein
LLIGDAPPRWVAAKQESAHARVFRSLDPQRLLDAHVR